MAEGQISPTSSSFTSGCSTFANAMSTFNSANHGASRPICRYFRRGTCQYGDRCRFTHPVAENASGSNTRVFSASREGAAALSPSTSSRGTDNRVSNGNKTKTKFENWVNAPEFVPGAGHSSRSYAEVASPATTEAASEEGKLCPFMDMNGMCMYHSKGACRYLHADICDLCGVPALHPFDQEKRKKHTQECIQQHERDMELSFAVARSKEKSCGVCFEVIMEKSSREQRFGILPNCNHCFCLTCIRKWRQARQFDNKIIRACPECRVTSDFVCPSMYWVDTKEEKQKLIDDYKCALARKDCKYFKQGRGKCPFGNKCFYLHALPDGTKRDVGPPPRQPRRQNHEGDIDVLQDSDDSDDLIWELDFDSDDHPDVADDDLDLVALLNDEFMNYQHDL